MGKYKYVLEEDYKLYVPELTGQHLITAYFTCEYGHCTIKKGYAWDGCTGVPDTSKTYYASLVHDALYQYGKIIGLKQLVADRWFLYLLKKHQFRLYWLYYAGVRVFGWMYYLT